jgi:hypothetical protein
LPELRQPAAGQPLQAHLPRMQLLPELRGLLLKSNLEIQDAVAQAY